MTYVFLLTLVAALGGLLFGYDTAVIAGAIGYLQARFDLSPFWEGFAAACALAGCALGAGSAGFLSDHFGRKRVLLLSAGAFFISALGTALPRSFAEFLVFRFIGGVGIGAASITSPMYIAEITPFRIRGRMVSVNQLAIVSGMLIVYFVNYFIAEYGLARDKRVVAAHTARSGTALEVPFARQFLQKHIPKMVERQIEQFLVEPRKVLDREAVAGFLGRLGMVVEPGEVSAQPGPIAPAYVREYLGRQLPEANRRRIDRFLAEPRRLLDSQLVAEFLAESEIAVKPVDVDLAARGMIGWNVRHGWRWMFGSGVLPAVIFLALVLLVPESPRWLVKRQRTDEALAILTRVDGPDFAQAELRNIQETLAQETGSLAQLWQPRLRFVMVLGVALAVLQQVTGVNVFLYFAPEIFKRLGAGESAALLQTVIVGAVNMAFTILAIGVVDRLGRRPLMLIGASGMGIALTALGLAAYWQLFQWWALVFVLGYIACFAMSVGPVTWVILSEIFPTQLRGRAMGIATICLWLANFVVSQTFPIMDKHPWLLVRFHHGFPFWVYAAFCALEVFVVWRYVPETKGKTLEQLERELVD